MSSQQRPVPQIGRGPQQFSQSFQQPIAPILQPPQRSGEESMAIEIYSQLAISCIESGGGDAARFQELAAQARAAARAYFQGPDNA